MREADKYDLLAVLAVAGILAAYFVARIIFP